MHGVCVVRYGVYETLMGGFVGRYKVKIVSKWGSDNFGTVQVISKGVLLGKVF